MAADDPDRPAGPAPASPDPASEASPEVLPTLLLSRLLRAFQGEEPDAAERERVRQALLRRVREPVVREPAADEPPIADQYAAKAAGRRSAAASTVPRLLTIVPGEDGWAPWLPGIDRKLLLATPQAVSLLLRLADGATLPAHDHAGTEECVVLSGAVELEGRAMPAGTFHVAPGGVCHQDMRAVGAVVLYLRIATA